MKENSYYAMLKQDIEREIGGKVIKLADKSTLGLPDSIHVKDSFATWIETKVFSDEKVGAWASVPKIIAKDLRQFEVCKQISKHSLVLYAIYFPHHKCSLVLTISCMETVRAHASFTAENCLDYSRGVPQIRHFQNLYRESLREKL